MKFDYAIQCLEYYNLYKGLHTEEQLKELEQAIELLKENK
jgi:hypothetical protein